MSNHLRNIRALFENAKSFKVSRKVDTYEYESLEKMILDDNIRYSEVADGQGLGRLRVNSNRYYRRVAVKNLM